MTTTTANEALVAAVDGLIWAALSGVGERMRTKPSCPRSERARAREIHPARMHENYPVDWEQIDTWKLLEGAWVRVREVAARYGVDPDCLTHALDEYTRALIVAKLAYSYSDVPRLLRSSPCSGSS